MKKETYKTGMFYGLVLLTLIDETRRTPPLNFFQSDFQSAEVTSSNMHIAIVSLNNACLSMAYTLITGQPGLSRESKTVIPCFLSFI